MEKPRRVQIGQLEQRDISPCILIMLLKITSRIGNFSTAIMHPSP
jgi:hypothetical protein